MKGEFAKERAEHHAAQRRKKGEGLATTSISVRLDHREALDALAAREGTSLAALIREAVETLLRGRRTIILGGVTLGECQAARFVVWAPGQKEAVAALESIEFEFGQPPIFHLAVEEESSDGVEEGQ